MISWLKKQLRARVVSSLEKWIISGGRQTAFVPDPENAKSVDVLYSCANVISEDLASVPVQLFERTTDGRRVADDHELYPIIHGSWNELMTGMEAREMLTLDATLGGNGFALLDMDRAGRVTGIYPVCASDIRIRVYDSDKDPRNWRPIYYLVANGEEEMIPAARLLHFRYKSFRPFLGQSPIAYHAESIGLLKSSETYGREFFENSARGDVYLKHPATLGPEAAKRLVESWKERTRDRHSPVVLEENMDVKSGAMPLKDLQMLELREFQAGRVAALYRIAPHKVGLMKDATFSNIENQDLDHVKSCIRPWAVRFETALNRCLLGPREAQKFYFEHNLDALMRGDIKSRYEAHGTAIQWGFMSPNQVARIENLPTYSGGDVRLVPVNMQRVDENTGELLPYLGKQPQPASQQ